MVIIQKVAKTYTFVASQDFTSFRDIFDKQSWISLFWEMFQLK